MSGLGRAESDFGFCKQADVGGDCGEQEERVVEVGRPVFEALDEMVSRDAASLDECWSGVDYLAESPVVAFG